MYSKSWLPQSSHADLQIRSAGPSRSWYVEKSRWSAVGLIMLISKSWRLSQNWPPAWPEGGHSDEHDDE